MVGKALFLLYFSGLSADQSDVKIRTQSSLQKAAIKRLKKFLNRRMGSFSSMVSQNIMTSAIVFMTSAWLAVAGWVYYAEKGAKDSNITSYGEAVWWGVVTFLTVGYGDRYPVTFSGRFAAVVLMVAGVSGVGVITAKISSYFMEKAMREGRGLMDSSRLKDHFIVCGWKDEMHLILTHILDFNSTLKVENLVLIANMNQASIDEIKMHPVLGKMNVIAGDYFSEVNLRRAAPERARKIMILADRTPHANGTLPTPTEVDARTIMTAMTLSTIAKGTLVAAEVLDPKMDQYLKIASVSEIIYTREYNRLLLANASGGTGVCNIIFDLLDPHTSAFLTTVPLPESCVEKPYHALRAHFAKGSDAVLIGVLENSGNRTSIKELALKRAQKTTDVNQLLINLKSVKEMKCNRPVFNPTDDYIVPDGAMAIVIEHRELNREQYDDSETLTRSA